MWGAEKDGEIILLDTAAAPPVAERLIERGQIASLKGVSVVRREVPFSGARFDFLVRQRGREFPLEVKSCTLVFDRLAMFPDAVTVRGRKHVELLGKHGGVMLFIVHSSRPFAFLPDFHTDPDFAKTLYTFRERLTMCAVAVRFNEAGEFEYVRELRIPWEIYEKEAQDRGSYILSGYLKEGMTLPIGHLGKRDFPRGFYLYVGSAMGSLSRRMGRHLRKTRKPHWHIDFLLPFLENLQVFPIRSSERLECAIAEALGSIAPSIPSFGASDCSCVSHLFYLPSPPLQNGAFVDILLHFRMGRIGKTLQELLTGENPGFII